MQSTTMKPVFNFSQCANVSVSQLEIFGGMNEFQADVIQLKFVSFLIIKDCIVEDVQWTQGSFVMISRLQDYD